ncbi:hypothetical protein [Kitasatospora sp. NPDC001132]
MRQGLAYPCFATRDEHEALRADQLAKKAPSGYYGQWTPWRDADSDAVREQLTTGTPYVVRFLPLDGLDRVKGLAQEMDDARGCSSSSSGVPSGRLVSTVTA